MQDKSFESPNETRLTSYMNIVALIKHINSTPPSRKQGRRPSLDFDDDFSQDNDDNMAVDCASSSQFPALALLTEESALLASGKQPQQYLCYMSESEPTEWT